MDFQAALDRRSDLYRVSWSSLDRPLEDTVICLNHPSKTARVHLWEGTYVGHMCGHRTGPFSARASKRAQFYHARSASKKGTRPLLTFLLLNCRE